MHRSTIGKTVNVNDIFKNGEFIDVVSVTKGKGWAGTIKRFGTARLYHKATQKTRHIGTLGPFTPGKVLFTVPQAGQMGFNYRTEYNKRILKIGKKEEAPAYTPSAGFQNYGKITNEFLMLDGSISGTGKEAGQAEEVGHQQERQADQGAQAPIHINGATQMTKVDVFSIDGKKKGFVAVPDVFEEIVKPELILRAVNAENTRRLQPQGHNPMAGMDTTAMYYGAMHSYRTGRHMGIAISPRQKLGGGQQGMVRRIPSSTKGRRAHPHRIEKILIEQMNKREYTKAIGSAIAASVSQETKMPHRSSE